MPGRLPIVTIDGGEVEVPYRVPVTVLATVEGRPANTFLRWYVDSRLVTPCADWLVILGEDPGFHRVDLLVVSAHGEPVGMASTWIRVQEGVQ